MKKPRHVWASSAGTLVPAHAHCALVDLNVPSQVQEELFSDTHDETGPPGSDAVPSHQPHASDVDPVHVPHDFSREHSSPAATAASKEMMAMRIES